MEGKRIFDLAEELIDWLKIAHVDASKVKIEKGSDNLFFVHDGDKEYVNPKYLSLDKQFEINQLADFVRLHNDIDEDSLKKILCQNRTMFQFLMEVISVVPNFVQESRSHTDEKYLSYTYAANKMYPVEKETGLTQ